MKRICKVIMLPTEDISLIFISKRDKNLHYYFKGNKPNNVKSYQHLYFTTDEEIKVGDWIYHKLDNTIIKWDGKDTNPFKYGYKKIIATTDKSLRIINSMKMMKSPYIPQIPQSFIEEYCDKNGIDEVMVEYKVNTVTKGTNEFDFYEEDIKTLKLTTNNEITIYPVKTNYTRKEVKELCMKAYSDGSTDMYNTSRRRKSWTFSTTENSRNWIKNNL